MKVKGRNEGGRLAIAAGSVALDVDITYPCHLISRDVVVEKYYSPVSLYFTRRSVVIGTELSFRGATFQESSSPFSS
jgi:hypothetical protein